MGLTNRNGSKSYRFEVDSAMAARAFLGARKIARSHLDYDIVLRRSALVINAPLSVRATAADWGCALG
jgi:hypothetical protein